jgi:nitrous oxidase accessory protein NosD
MRAGFYLLLAASVWLVSSNTTAFAANNCTFRTGGTMLKLQADCWTDATLSIPDGMTLDGRGHTITAIDPEGGHFVGAVVRNAGAIANVRNLTIEARALADVCDGEGPPDQRLRGILFEEASGTIARNHVRNVNQGSSGCQEGAGIEVRGGLAEGAPLQRVSIVNNRVEAYQKTGVFVSGAVEAEVVRNDIVGFGPVGFIGQNGIQLGFGARGRIERNRVGQNLYTGADVASTGILLIEAGSSVVVDRNRLDDNDIGIRVVSTSDVDVVRNEVSRSTFDGIAIDGLAGAAEGNRVFKNRLSDNAIGVDVFGTGAIYNEVIDNRIDGSLLAGIQVAFGATRNLLERNRLRGNATGVFVSGDGNEVVGNSVTASDGLDVENVGDNVYGNNRCESSSGPPVDCP